MLARMLFLSKTALAHALIVSAWQGWVSQIVFMEKCWPGLEDDPIIENGWPNQRGETRPLFIYLFIYLKIRTMYRGENNRTRSPLLGSPSYSDPIKCRKTNPLPQKTRIKY